jgi:predicted transglutaminase-like cysteine proteinase
MVCFCLSYLCFADYDYDPIKFSTLAKLRYGQETFKTVLELNQLIVTLKLASDLEKLKKINDFFNQKITFADDIDIWNEADYWATPLESLGMHAGDCEDYSIAKYVFLRVLKIPNEKLRLTYVKAQISNQEGIFFRAHMVLTYYPSAQSEPLILDNLNPEILPSSNRKDLFPIFGFNDKGLWTGISTEQKGDSQAHLSKWRKVLSNIRADGIE